MEIPPPSPFFTPLKVEEERAKFTIKTFFVFAQIKTTNCEQQCKSNSIFSECKNGCISKCLNVSNFSFALLVYIKIRLSLILFVMA